MSKKIFVFAIILIALSSPLFAAVNGSNVTVSSSGAISGDNSSGSSGSSSITKSTIPLSIVYRLIAIILIVGGAFLLVRGTWDLVHGLIHQSDDPRGVVKAVVNLAIGLLLLIGFWAFLTYVLPSLESGGSDGNNNVITGLTGALVKVSDFGTEVVSQTLGL